MPRSILEHELGFFGRDMFKRDVALDPEASGLPPEVGDGDGIVEDVVNPSETMGLGFNFEPGIEKPLILAAARAQHHPVLSQPNGRNIGVGRHMVDRQYRHSLSMRSAPAARAHSANNA